jgi:hypothetical protein
MMTVDEMHAPTIIAMQLSSSKNSLVDQDYATA